MASLKYEYPLICAGTPISLIIDVIVEVFQSLSQIHTSFAIVASVTSTVEFLASNPAYKQFPPTVIFHSNFTEELLKCIASDQLSTDILFNTTFEAP